MPRITFGALVLLLASSVSTESGMDQIHSVIDATVWKPFQTAFERMDGQALNAVYADEVLRATPEGLDTLGHFKRFNKSRFDENRARGDSVALDFWFDSRRTSPTVSYDVGFYRVRVFAATGETTNFYGQFHIVLKKLDGHWKIVQDWDTATIGGRPITAEDFSRKPPARF